MGTHTTFFKVAAANDCRSQRVTLEGRAVARLFEWTPPTLDFGSLAPNTELLRDVTFSNHSDQPVSVTNLATSPAAPHFRVVTGTSLTVAPGGTASVTIGLRPPVLGPRLGVLNFNTPVPMLLVGAVPLRGSGGAPALSVAPTLDFGRVAYFPTASPPTSQARDLQVSNSGPRFAPPGARANLHFGVNGQVPYFDVVPGSGTAAGEFTVAFGATYDPVLGLDSGASLPLRVTFTPGSAGLHQDVARALQLDVRLVQGPGVPGGCSPQVELLEHGQLPDDVHARRAARRAGNRRRCGAWRPTSSVSCGGDGSEPVKNPQACLRG